MAAHPLGNIFNFGGADTSSVRNTTTTAAAATPLATTLAPTAFDSVAVSLASFLNLYYTPLLVVLGSIGNLLSVFVFYRSKLRLQSTSQYLTALALSDTLFLLQLLPPWLNAVHSSGLFHRHGFCQIFVYVSYVTCSFSAWLVVAFTVERFVAVLYPLRRNAVCTLQRARHVITGVALASLLLNVPVLRFAVPTTNDCNIDHEYLVHAARFNLVDTAVSFTVPLAVIIVLNTWIMIGVCRLERTRQQLIKAEQQLEVLGSRVRPIRQLGCPRSQHRVTRMLLIVSSVFVCFNLPAYTMRIIAYAYDMGERDSGGRWAALQQVALMFFNTNFGINFILYCLSGQNFRRALVHTIPRLPRRARRAMAMRRAASSDPTRRPSTASTSFMSNGTEGTSTWGASAAATNRRRRPDQFISRWTFDNSRQRRMMAQSRGDFEMVQLRQLGQMGQMGHLGQVGQVGQMGPVRAAPLPRELDTRRLRSMDPPPRSIRHPI